MSGRTSARISTTPVPNDPWRDRFLPPDFAEQDDRARMARRQDRPGLLQARRQGRQQRDPRHRLEDARIPPGREAALSLRRSGAQHRRSGASACALWCARTIARARFLWKLFSDLFLYSAEMVPEISDRIVEIDRAMRWGYANKLGPFELWDALGLRGRRHAAGDRTSATLPANVEKHARARRELVLSAVRHRRASRHRVLRFPERTIISRSSRVPALCRSPT